MAVLNTEIALIQKWSDLLSQSCEPDANGVILLDNFVQKVHELLPELSHADIEETVDNVDGTMGAKEGRSMNLAAPPCLTRCVQSNTG